MMEYMFKENGFYYWHVNVCCLYPWLYWLWLDMQSLGMVQGFTGHTSVRTRVGNVGIM